MAGDWLKVEASTPEKAEVLAITARMGWDDADLTVGKLFRLWRWFDQQTVDGNAATVTTALLDRIVGVSGFCEAVRDAGWLTIADDGISLPGFDKHNGNTAKSRSMTAKRVAKHKAFREVNAKTNAANVSGALPREEKRREDQDQKKPTAPKPKKVKSGDELIILPDWVPKQEWADYVQMRKEKKKPVNQSIAARVIKKLDAMRLDGHNIRTALENSIVNCWTDIFEPRVNFNGTGTNTERSRPLSAVERVAAKAAERECQRQRVVETEPGDGFIEGEYSRAN